MFKNFFFFIRFASKNQKDLYLNKLTSMELLSSYCLTEPGSGSDSAAMKTFAKKDGDDYVINGSKVNFHVK